MEVIEFGLQNDEIKNSLLSQMWECDWDAGRYLHWMLSEKHFIETCGEGSKALMLVENGVLMAFCTLAPFDEIASDTMKPWIGFVYTFPKFRGRRCSGVLVEHAVELAKADGAESIYVSSEETGLYEKYGFAFLQKAMSVHGYETQIFKRDLR